MRHVVSGDVKVINVLNFKTNLTQDNYWIIPYLKKLNPFDAIKLRLLVN